MRKNNGIWWSNTYFWFNFVWFERVLIIDFIEKTYKKSTARMHDKSSIMVTRINENWWSYLFLTQFCLIQTVCDYRFHRKSAQKNNGEKPWKIINRDVKKATKFDGRKLIFDPIFIDRKSVWLSISQRKRIEKQVSMEHSHVGNFFHPMIENFLSTFSHQQRRIFYENDKIILCDITSQT